MASGADKSAIVCECFAAVASGDRAREVAAAFHPEAIIMPTPDVPQAPYRPFFGPAGWLAWRERLLAEDPAAAAVVEHVEARGDDVLVFGHLVLPGPPVRKVAISMVWSFDGDRIQHVRSFRHRQEALERFGERNA